MTTATATSSFASVCALPSTPSDRFLLWTSRTVAAFAVARMQRRAAAPAAAGEAAADERRTALALGAVGILPR